VNKLKYETRFPIKSGMTTEDKVLLRLRLTKNIKQGLIKISQTLEIIFHYAGYKKEKN